MTQQRFWTGIFSRLASAMAAASLVLIAGSAMAQDYPTKPVTIVTILGAGSSVEIEARLLAAFAEKELKQPVIVESRPGAGGSIGTQYVARARPDGYTLLYSGASLTTFKTLIKDLSFDPIKDLAPISQVSEFVSIYLTNAQSGFKTMDDLVAYAKANPGKLNYGSAGKNTVMMSTEVLKRLAGINLVEIPYPGQAQYITALLRNDVQFVQGSISGSARGLIDSGQLRILLVCGDKRSRAYPDVPTTADRGWLMPKNSWSGLFAPGGTPKALIDQLQGVVARYAASPESKKRELDGTIVMVGSTAEQFRQQVESDARIWASVASELGIKPD